MRSIALSVSVAILVGVMFMPLVLKVAYDGGMKALVMLRDGARK